MSSTDSDKISVSSAPSSPVKGAPPPVPPKPLSSCSGSSVSTSPPPESTYLNTYEILTSPLSPSYEDRFETNTGLVSVSLSKEVGYNENTQVTDIGSPNNNTSQSMERTTTPSSLTPTNIVKRGSHKEFYTLPCQQKQNSTKE